MTNTEISQDDALEAIAVALFQAWFPNGHGGVHDESLREDFDAWVDNAIEDAKIAVSALVNLGLISFSDSAMVDSKTKDERNK